MIFKLHYWLLTAGASAIGILLGVFIETYTDASSVEIGALFMLMPFLGLIFRPIICSYADRHQAHQKYMLWLLFITGISYSPFVIIPMIGEQFYGQHPRISWYILVFFKIFGDISFGGMCSIGDSMAINYAKRIGTEFAIYRVWGTISWIVFGLIIGQVNEIWFLPKYTPAFIILILCSFLDMSLFWLWPKEYFIMVTDSEMEEQKQEQNQSHQIKYKESIEQKQANSKMELMTRSLMPKDVVWAHIKARLYSLVSCGCFSCRKTEVAVAQGRQATTDNNDKSTQTVVIVEQPAKRLSMSNGQEKTTSNNVKKELESKQQQQQEQQHEHEHKLEQNGLEEERGVNKLTQIKILFLLIRRDIRIVSYFCLFILAGLFLMTANFFFMNLSEICHQGELCNYSNLAGFLQASMASAETLFFIYIKEIKQFFGRVPLAALALFLLAIKFGFYGTFWLTVHPYYSLAFEIIHGVVFGVFITLQVETAHMFANEVEYVIPELIEKRIVKKSDEVEKIKLSLAATMQSLMSSANDGIGRGFGALFYGIIVQKYSYEILWRILGITFGVCSIITFAVSIISKVFNLNVGLNNQSLTKNQLSKKTIINCRDNDSCCCKQEKQDKNGEQTTGIKA